MFALFVAWYNFCRTQMTLKTLSAVAAGLASAALTRERLWIGIGPAKDLRPMTRGRDG
jgi:hypothetical protein